VQADFAVELGAGDEHLELPWSSSDGTLRYCDLKRQPELLACIEEARRIPELGEFLRAVNGKSSILQSVKCDAWFTAELNPEEDIFGVTGKFGSYVDLVFDAEPRRFSFEAHEQWVRRIAQLLKRVPEMPAAAEFLVRRCSYHAPAQPVGEGFYTTFYLFGYADEETLAGKHWAIALKLVENAVRQISAEWRR
jgi:hypothetical protein